jgi:hypothetical protein
MTPRAAEANEFLGVNEGIAFDHRDLGMVADTGATTDRFLLGWRTVEPSEGTFRWGAVDRVVGGSAARGIRPLPFVWGSPSWAAPTAAYPPIQTASARHAWQEFLEAAVHRYGAGGSYWSSDYQRQFGTAARPRPVRAWQVWTEPNGKAYSAPRSSVQDYATLLRISHDAIKAAAPRARVVLGGLVGLRRWHGRVLKGVSAWEFLRRLYEVPGIKRDFDVVGVHPYAPNIHQLRRELRLTRSAMRHGGDSHTNLWVTELGWGSAPRGSGNSALDLNKGSAGQRQLLHDSFTAIVNHRARWRVRRLYWYDWRDPSRSQPAPCSFCETAGLLRHDRTPKPALRPFKRLAKSLNG